MRKEREALKLALEALDIVKIHFTQNRHVNEAITAIKEALAQPEQLEGLQLIHKADIDLAKKRAIEAQPEQEPVAAIRALSNQCAALIQERDELQKQVWRYEKNGVTCQTYQHKIDRTCSECNVQEDYTTTPQIEQEPVATVQCINGVTIGYLDVMQPIGTKLYTTPPQRTWVGMTDDDIAVVLTGDASLGTRLDELTPSWIELVKAVEAKLKEKNT